ncbi:hypothetical protein BH10ACT11_BH10ACT11_08280 [soil metagenome]
MVASLIVGGLLLVTRSRLAWSAAAALGASAIAGYVISRTTGLPNATDDVGNWTEPLGLASLFVEGCVVTLSAVALTLPSPTNASRRRLAGVRGAVAGEPDAA